MQNFGQCNIFVGSETCLGHAYTPVSDNVTGGPMICSPHSYVVQVSILSIKGGGGPNLSLAIVETTWRGSSLVFHCILHDFRDLNGRMKHPRVFT